MATDVADQADTLPAMRSGAKALLLTVFGEFVLPAGGEAWTSSLIRAAAELGIGEKNARQAIARIGEQGLVSSTRHGRNVRWALTPNGRRLLEDGAERIYRLGVTESAWTGAWLVAHCPVAEAKRTVRNQLRTQLAFLGFGELSANLLISPNVDREPALRRGLDELGLLSESLVLRSTVDDAGERARMVATAWDLERLAADYADFQRAYEGVAPDDDAAAFRATVFLVHDWRRFPFIDPDLPSELLPAPWIGHTSAQLFQASRQAWSDQAQGWFNRLEAS